MSSISVNVPSLNVAPYIQQCLDSIKNQTYQDLEIICVDAGSTDGTLEIIEENAASDRRIVVLHSDKKVMDTRSISGWSMPAAGI